MESDDFDMTEFKAKKVDQCRALHAYYTRRLRESGNRWRSHRRDQMRREAKNYAFWRGWSAK